MIIDSRPKLQAILDDPASTLMLLAPGGGIHQDIHDAAVQATEAQDWRETVLLKKLSILKSEERAAWLPAGMDYCVLGGGVPKKRGPQGPKEDLLLADGSASPLKIRSKFAEGDQL